MGAKKIDFESHHVRSRRENMVWLRSVRGGQLDDRQIATRLGMSLALVEKEWERMKQETRA